MSLILELALDALVAVAEALFPASNERLEAWRKSDSPSLRVIASLIILDIILLIAFLVYWFFIR